MKNYCLLSILLIAITISGYSQNKLTKEEKRTLHKIGLIIRLTTPDAVPPRNIAESSTLGGKTYNGLSVDEHFKRSDKSLQILNKIVDDIDPYNSKSSEIIFNSIESFSSKQDPIKIVRLDKEFQLLLADPAQKKISSRADFIITDEEQLKLKNKRIENQKKYDKIYQHLINNGFDGLLVINVQHWSTFAVKFQLGNGSRWTSQAYTGYYASIYSIDDKLLFRKKYFSKAVPALKYKKSLNDFIKNHTEKVFKEIMK